MKVGRDVIVEEHPDHDAVNRLSSGIHVDDGNAREQILRLLAGQVEINAVRTELDILVPGDAPVGRYMHLVEERTIGPGGEDTSTYVTRKVYFTFDSILVANPDPVIRERANLADLHHLSHSNIRRTTVAAEGKFWKSARPRRTAAGVSLAVLVGEILAGKAAELYFRLGDARSVAATLS